MDIKCFNVKKEQISDVLHEQTFHIGEHSEVEITVILYENKGKYYITSWLNGCEECNTEEYKGSVKDEVEVTSAMKALVEDNREYIMEVANWDGD